MKMTENTDQLLRCLMHIIGRATIPHETVYDIIGAGKKQIAAFNMCDGTLTQTEISKKTGIDSGNLSRTVARWVTNGIAFRIGEGKDAKLLHIYPISPAGKRKIQRKKK